MPHYKRRVVQKSVPMKVSQQIWKGKAMHTKSPNKFLWIFIKIITNKSEFTIFYNKIPLKQHE